MEVAVRDGVRFGNKVAHIVNVRKILRKSFAVYGEFGGVEYFKSACFEIFLCSLNRRDDSVGRRVVRLWADFGPRPAQGAMLTLDGKAYKVKTCTEEAGVLAIELEAVRS